MLKRVFFYVKTAKVRWRLGATSPDPLSLQQLGGSPLDPRLCSLPLAESWVHHCIWGRQFAIGRISSYATDSFRRSRHCPNYAVCMLLVCFIRACDGTLIFSFVGVALKRTVITPEINSFLFSEDLQKFCRPRL